MVSSPRNSPSAAVPHFWFQLAKPCYSVAGSSSQIVTHEQAVAPVFRIGVVANPFREGSISLVSIIHFVHGN
jgi:hypothetical protein